MAQSASGGPSISNTEYRIGKPAAGGVARGYRILPFEVRPFALEEQAVTSEPERYEVSLAVR